MAEKELHRKRVLTRNGHRLVLRNNINKAKELLPPSGAELNVELKPKLEAIRNLIERKRTTVEEIDNEILESCDSDSVEKEIVDRSELESEVEDILCLIANALIEKSQSEPTTNLQANLDNSIGSSHSRENIKVKLPKLSLPSFDGDITQWTSFWESFSSTIHECSSLADIDKFKYLQQALKGHAAETIAGLPISNRNYHEALELLQKRYGNKQIIISKYVETLIGLPTIESSNDLHKLRCLFDKTEATVRSLRGVGVSEDNYGTILTPIIMAKVPSELRIIISRNLSEEWDLTGVLENFGKELALREKCAFAPISNKKTHMEFKAKSRNGIYNEAPATTATLMVNQDGQRVPTCLFCCQQHFSSSCTKVTNPNARKQILKEKRRCFICLRGGHISKQCNSGSKCYNCRGKHHVSICGSQPESHPQAVTQYPSTQQQSARVAQQPPVSTSLLTTRDDNNVSVLLQTAKATVHRVDDDNQSCNVRIILDSCSQKSYITKRVREKLQLPYTKLNDKILIKEFGNEQGTLKYCNMVQLAVRGADNLVTFINAYEVDVICSPISGQAIDFARWNYPHLRNLPLADGGKGENLEIDVLIGADHIWGFLLDHVVRGEHGLGPVATLTRFGYVLSGPIILPATNEHSSNVIIAHTLKIGATLVDSEQEEIHDALHKFWDYETLGINNKTPHTNDEVNPLKDNIEFDNEAGKYECRLPFKDEHSSIADNYDIAQKRLNSLVNRLKRNPETLHDYNNVIQDQLNAGVIEEVSNTDESNAGNVYYNPHREVIRADRQTTKLRVVYDASSKSKNETSLNEHLDSGPNLVPLVFDILLRFRSQKVALIGDLEKAFLNIIIHPSHRDYLRFLWYDDVFADNPTLKTFRFTRLVFGLTSSPYVLNATIRHHLNKYRQIYPEFVSTVENSLYIDDFASSQNSEEQCFELYRKLKTIFAEGGFNMRKWASNNKSLISRIEEAEKQKIEKENKNEQISKSDIRNIICSEENVKVLGLTWHLNEDNLEATFSNLITTSLCERVTKRVVLSTTARFYDPLGMLSPVVVPLKEIFQKICELKINWDDELPLEISSKWLKIVQDIIETKQIKYPRCLMSDIDMNDVQGIQLHGFADSSQVAYSACIYIRIQTLHRTVIRLVCSKTRIVPLKKDTIPRLELIAALMLAVLMTSVYNALKITININEIHCWTDSQVVLHWIRSNKTTKQTFVNSRIDQIQKLVGKDCWEYCPTNLNPADIASRGILCSKIVSNSLWWNGPPYLQQEKEFWPKMNSAPSQTEEIISNVVSVENKQQPNLNAIIVCEKFNSYNKLIRSTAQVFRFINILKSKIGKMLVVSENEPKNINSTIKQAKILWQKHVQNEFDFSGKDRDVKENLNVFADENGVYRVGGRLQNAPIPYNAKHPIILPRKHHFSNLAVWKSHLELKHNGVNETLIQLRTEYWIPKGRQFVKSVISKCTKCKEIHGKAYDTPVAPPLPCFRVSEDSAFTNVGVDFAGPLFVRDIYDKSKKMHKCYIALFTCANTRALHLELVPSLKADPFIRALKRFMSRRGITKLIISDNGTTFLDSKVQTYVQNLNITWKFNVPTASWWGGWWEICVKLTKLCLRKTLGKAKVTYEELNTVLIEVEGILNSRPLTYVSEEFSEPPITPSCLVIGKRILDQHGSDSLESNHISVTKRARYLETLLHHFQNRFKKEYLPSLREKQRSKLRKARRIVKIGDIVHIHKDKSPKHCWSMGKVIRLLPGKDKIVRAVELKTHNKAGKLIVMKRPIQHLYPLEISQEEEQEAKDNENEEPQITLVRDQDVVQFINS